MIIDFLFVHGFLRLLKQLSSTHNEVNPNFNEMICDNILSRMIDISCKELKTLVPSFEFQPKNFISSSQILKMFIKLILTDGNLANEGKPTET